MENIYHKILNLPQNVSNPNYYELLGIQEGSHNPALIESHYKEQIQKVQRMGNNPKYKEAILFIKGELRKARAVLANPTGCTEYGLVLLTERVERIREKISIFLVKGYLVPKEKEYILNEGKKIGIPPLRIERVIQEEIQKKGVRNVSLVNSSGYMPARGLFIYLLYLIRFLWACLFRVPPSSPLAQKRQSSYSPKTSSLIIWSLTFASFTFLFLTVLLLFLFLEAKEDLVKSEIALKKMNMHASVALVDTKKIKKKEPDEKSDIPEKLPLKNENNRTKVPPKNSHIDNKIKNEKPDKQENSHNFIKIFPVELIYVPAGVFYMGNDMGSYDQRPERQIYLDGYYISKYEIKNKEYKEFVDATGFNVPWGFRYEDREFNWSRDSKDYPEGRGNHPVTLVSWNDAMAYCKWFSDKFQCEASLPTEAQWEKAARGDSRSLYPWGNSPPGEGGVYKANYWASSKGSKDGFAKTAPVGSFSNWGSPYGCQDMAGNVWEWCLDWYSEYAYKNANVKNPQGPSSGNNLAWKVLRGGSWYDAEVLICSTSRWGAPIDERDIRWGFRLVINPEKKEEGKWKG